MKEDDDNYKAAMSLILLATAIACLVPWVFGACRAHAGAWDGVLQPFKVTVPRYDSPSGCVCQDTSECEPDDDPVTVRIEADGGWRKFYRSWTMIDRDSVLLVNDWQLPAGYWKCRVQAFEPGSPVQGCWGEPFGRVSVMPRRARPQ